MKMTFISLLLLLCMAGCQDDLPQSAKIEAGKESLAFSQGSGTQTVKITASHAWTAASSGSWLTVSPDKGGAGTHELTLTAAANTAASARTAQVNIQVGHKVSTINVSQAQKDALGLDRNSEVVAWPAGSVSFTLSANVDDYEITSDADWLQPSPLKAMTEQTLVLVYTENETYEERAGTVTVSNGTLTSSVTVTQGGRGALYFVIGHAEVVSTDVQYELALMKNTELSGLHLLDGGSWVSLPVDTKGMPAEERILLTFQPNMETEPREAKLVIRDESTGVLMTDTFTLVQRGLENMLMPEKELYEVAVDGEEFGIPVMASGPFEVILPEDAPWLAGTLQFTAEANTKPQSRTAVIVLRLQSEIPIEVTITVTQAAAEVTDTNRIPRLYNLLELGTVIETDPVNLGAFQATIGYDAGEPTGWVNDIYANGGKLHFRVEENGTAAKRSATIRLALDAGESVEIRINQSSAGEAYIELETPGTLASFVDFPNKDHYKRTRLVAGNGINADDINTLRNATLAIEEIDLSGVVITELPEGAFGGSRTLRRLVLPAGLLKIGNGAFADSHLEEVVFAGTPVLTAIGDRAFEGCSDLTIRSFPASLLSIGERAFAGAFTGSESSHLDLSAAAALRTIGREAFRACNTLTQLTLPVNLTEIGEGAFSECYNLTGTLVLPTLLTTVGAEAFYNCKNLTGTLALPASLMQLGERAFMRCAALEGLDLAASRLTTIGAEVFKESLSSASVGKVVIPPGVTVVAVSAFEDTGFTEADLPQTLAEIGRRAFYNCRNLSVVSCRRTGTVPALDASYPAETFGGVGITGQRVLKLDTQSVDLYKNDPSWILATPAIGGSIMWKFENI